MDNYINEVLSRGGVGGTPNETCKHCGKLYTKEGHDGCLGTLIGVMNACCGHGDERYCYVQFLDGECIRGKDAIEIIKILKKCSKNKIA